MMKAVLVRRWPVTPLHGMRALYLMLITQSLSLIGSRMTTIGLGLWLFTQTQTTAPLLLVAFLMELPGMLLGSVAGAVIDRVPRKPVLILTDAGLALGTLILLATILTDTFSIVLLYGVALIQGALTIFQSPASEASLSLMTPDQGRDRINGLRQMLFPFAGIVAPALTGLLYLIGGIALVFAVDLATFVLAAGALCWIHIPQPAAPPADEAATTLWQDWRTGLRFVRHQPGLLALLVNTVVGNYLLNGSLEITIPYVVTITGSEVVTGLVLTAMSVGAFVGGAIIAARGNIRNRVPWLLLGNGVVALMYVIYGRAQAPWLLATALFFLMIPLPMGGALMQSLLQTRVPTLLQGRIFALYAQLGFLGSTASFLSIGPLVDQILEPGVSQPWWQMVTPLVGAQPGAGMALLLVITGLLMGLTTLLLWSIPAVRRLDEV
ncbi:MAG: MFS transporter [Caldilineaceae bacterium]|nr:MFS transporter [Caldilineaceae bacterium]